MTHHGNAQNSGDVHFTLEAGDLCGHIVLKEVGADGVAGDLQTDLLGVGPELGGKFLLGLAFGSGEFYELDGVKTEFLGLVHDLEQVHFALVQKFVIAVRAYGSFHVVSSYGFFVSII